MTFDSEQDKFSGIGHSFENTGLRLLKPRFAFEEDNGITSTGTTPTVNETPVNQSTQATTTEIKNPDGLLNAYEALKAENKELRSFKTQAEQVKQAEEAKRLEQQGQYEALIPLKVKEALDPVNQSLEAERQAKETVSKKLAKLESEYNNLQAQYKQEKLQRAVNQLFMSPEIGGDPAAEKLFWSAYGSNFDLDNDGKPVAKDGSELPKFLEGLKSDPAAQRLFLAKVPEGSGTLPQGTTTGGQTKTPIAISSEAALNLKKAGVTLEQIAAGEVLIKR
jgi:hypothetical protein